MNDMANDARLGIGGNNPPVSIVDKLKVDHKQALRWLHEHGGSAVRVNRRGASGRLSGGRQAVLSQGDFAPFTWATFKRLIEHGHIRERAGFRIQVVVQS